MRLVNAPPPNGGRTAQLWGSSWAQCATAARAAERSFGCTVQALPSIDHCLLPNDQLHVMKSENMISQFPRAAVTNQHRRGDLKQDRFILLLSQRLDIEIRMLAGLCEQSGKIFLCHVLAPGGSCSLWHSLAHCRITSVSPSIVMWPSPLYLCVLCFLVRTSLRLRTYPNQM